jgi:hypothetical protein
VFFHQFESSELLERINIWIIEENVWGVKVHVFDAIGDLQ